MSTSWKVENEEDSGEKKKEKLINNYNNKMK